jgi:hypothetical protein
MTRPLWHKEEHNGSHDWRQHSIRRTSWVRNEPSSGRINTQHIFSYLFLIIKAYPGRENIQARNS